MYSNFFPNLTWYLFISFYDYYDRYLYLIIGETAENILQDDKDSKHQSTTFLLDELLLLVQEKDGYQKTISEDLDCTM